MRKFIVVAVLTLVAAAALRMAARAGRRGAPQTTALLWMLIHAAASPSITRNTPRDSATKTRLDNLLSTLWAASGNTTAAAVGANNTSTGLPGNTITAAPGSYTQTWGLQVEATVGNIWVCLNTLQKSYANTCTDLDNLQTKVNTWHAALQAAGLL